MTTTTYNLNAVTLDIAHEGETLADALFVMTKDLDSLTYRVIDPQGPGAGWPVVRFQGDMSDIVALTMVYADGDANEAYALLMA